MESELRIDGGKGSQQIPSQDNHDQCICLGMARNVHLLVDSSDFEDMLSRHLDMVGLLSLPGRCLLA